MLIRPSLVHHVRLHRHVTICCQFSSSIQIIDMFSIEVDTIQNIWLAYCLYGRCRLYCKYVHREQLQLEEIHKRNKSNLLWSLSHSHSFVMWTLTFFSYVFDDLYVFYIMISFNGTFLLNLVTKQNYFVVFNKKSVS